MKISPIIKNNSLQADTMPKNLGLAFELFSQIPADFPETREDPLPVVSNNLKEFSRISELKTENWSET